MSSGDDHDAHHAATTAAPQVKKRRIQTVRACDRCRLKKIRCDGTPAPGTRCSHCATADAECVFTPGTKQKRQPAPKKHEYVDALELRVEKLESLLARLHPNTDFSKELDGEAPVTPHSAASWGAHAQRSASASSEHNRFPHVLFDDSADIDANDEPLLHSPEPLDSDEEEGEDISGQSELVRRLRDMNISGPLMRYYGRSSSVRLFRTALNLKSEVAGSSPDIMNEVMANAERRPDFWKIHPWERTRFSREQKSPFVFPDADLMGKLVEQYFMLTHRLCPVLHYPTFSAYLAEGKHLREEGFGNVVLLVCALGSRFVDDPRVFLSHPEKPAHPHSAGWTWFNQVQLVRNVALADPTLFDLQAMALSVIFLAGMSPPQACWTMAGIGIRMAQDVGAHRRKMYTSKCVDGELWKRAFWMLVTLDIWFSSFLGRPCAIALDSFDVDFPLECDDEYWLHPDPAQAFKQPAGKPSYTSYTVAWIKLQLIHSHALRTIYSLEKHKIIAKIGEQEWEKRVVSELDSALNRWIDALPDHLRWDPDRVNEVHFFQSVALHASYHLVQMTIHRPFIPSSHKSSSISYPSLTICANSARACIHVLQAQARRMPGFMIMMILIPAFMAAIVLLLRIWVAKRAGMQIDVAKELKDVQKVIQFLTEGEAKWPLSGRFKDLLVTLATASDWSAAGAGAPPTAKRTRSGSDDGAYQFPPSSGLAHKPAAAAARTYTALGQVSTSGPASAGGMSTFGPPLAQHETAPPNAFPNFVSSPLAPPPAVNAASSSSGVRYQQQRRQDSAEHDASSSAFPAGVNGNEQQFYASAQYAPQRLASDFHSMFGTHMPSYDTPSPPSNQTSPAAHLGLRSELYGSLSAGLDSPNALGGAAPFTGGAPGAAFGADDLGKLFAPMVSHDGQMNVDGDIAHMWSSMPTTYQSEDWDQYISNMMGVGGANGFVPQQQAGGANGFVSQQQAGGVPEPQQNGVSFY